jgi:transcriptional regulator with XRE-family HTH domain
VKQQFRQCFEIRQMKLKDAGYLVKWAREHKRLSQYALADVLAKHQRPGPSPIQTKEDYDAELEDLSTGLRSTIANYEIDRVQVPLTFIELLTDALSLSADWHTNVQNSRQTSTHLGDNVLIASPVLVRRAPTNHQHPLKSEFIMDPKLFNKRAAFPHFFRVEGDDDASFPKLLADEIEKTDGKFKEGDRWAFRTDLIPEPGHVVRATGKKGESLRRYIVIRDGRMVLADPNEKEPDIPLTSIAAVEGVYVGWYRPGEEDADPDDAVTGSMHRRKGLRISDI